ncbi:MAG: hypothetical protein H9993_08110 [Candidatus Desulfovibrio faecigallinarum]|uniref:hypothetical protein n=1 Tax=Desulfovibrio sp. An276 TaxID=1965618 RepID=UPI0013A650CC|nr:hypothetical protein [Desulfovibrio sp. An276]MBU3832659.1 hypothetical protein [Candidatus Desulfovibrio faecigallinarum]
MTQQLPSTNAGKYEIMRPFSPSGGGALLPHNYFQHYYVPDAFPRSTLFSEKQTEA